MSRLWGRVCLWGLLAAPAVVLAAAAGCARSGARVPVRTVSAEAPAQYVGNAVCGQCHSREFELHSHSRHAITMRIATTQALGGLTPKAGRIPHSDYAVTVSGGALRFSRADRPAESAPIQLAFGSGKSGMTYVGLFGPDRMTEFRMSYVPRSKSWYVTPGQQGRADLDLGLVHDHGMAQRCVHCHSVTSPSGSVKPEPRYFGVGCESCHGPGSAHVAAASTPGATDLKMEKMGGWSAQRIDALCARCHRSAADVSLVTRDAGSTARFQPYGLELSPCFRSSGGRLSCVTCHDPHSNASTDPRHYEQVCLSCHGAGASSHARACPKSARSGCVACHMPQERIFPDTHLDVTMADHLIWAYRPQR